MAKNKKQKYQQQPASKPEVKKSAKANNSAANPLLKYLLPLGVVVVTFIAFYPALKNLFVNWDDPGYITQNGIIQHISLKSFFSDNKYQMGNFHPLTMLSYAIEYSFVKLSPKLYHFDSIAIHCLTTLLAFWFTKKLTKNNTIAAITAVLFGIHTMHVESVAWVSERKDVMFGFFFMAAMVASLFYREKTDGKQWIYYALIIVLFVCSLLSKAVAVPLPVVLLLIDYYQRRKLNAALFLEKIPFFILSLIFGYIAIVAQKSFAAIELGDKDFTYTFIERIFLASFALFTYLWKAVLPINLSCFYPYPLKEGSSLPLEYYFYLPLILGLGFLVWQFGRKNRDVIFGLGFFLVTIALLLQLLPVGSAIVADRYAYLGYFGLCFSAGWFVNNLLESQPQMRMVYLGVLIAYCGFITYLTMERCKVWKDTIALWTDCIEKYPKLPHAWNNLGFEYYEKDSFDKALPLFNKAIEMNPNFNKPYVNRAEIYRKFGQQFQSQNNIPKAIEQFNLAEKSFNKALEIDPETYEGYLGRAILYSILQKIPEAGKDFRRALSIKPIFPEAHCSFGNYYDMTGNYDSALYQYGLAIEQKPEFFDAYSNKAKAQFRKKQFKEAIPDLDNCIRIKPEAGEPYYYRSLCHYQLGDKQAALNDAQLAQANGFGVDPKYLEQLR
ncbi:MAG: tetratricopeptide repeat protein [Bacteroidetes bacterium]|nr:tetratricopeptide repeat protein [Bacteroidota bacterium]